MSRATKVAYRPTSILTGSSQTSELHMSRAASAIVAPMIALPMLLLKIPATESANFGSRPPLVKSPMMILPKYIPSTGNRPCLLETRFRGLHAGRATLELDLPRLCGDLHRRGWIGVGNG
jgi:hypothetical protein